MTSQEKKIKSVLTDESFDKRYKELDSDNPIFEDSNKMINDYFQVNNISQKFNGSTNHPVNIDQVLNEGFYDFCKSLDMEDKQIGMTLSICFSNYFTENFDFQLYSDNEPESSLRFLTLKYNKDGVVMSLYPFEYTLKVLNKESTYENLYLKIQNQLNQLPNKDETLKEMLSDIKNKK
ncbi:hypothetical protein [Pedobacter psychrophilus]|nr:hypothetical protein [Pedobacter psychrophilus]